jgi:hypothetical protein
MDSLKSDDLTIHVDLSVPECIRLDWTGRSNARNPAEAIGPFFDQVLAEAAGPERQIEMHFEALEHFNSSTIATLIHLINQAGKAKVALRIHYDAELKWQALSFEALQRAVQSFGDKGEQPKVEFLLSRAQQR